MASLQVRKRPVLDAAVQFVLTDGRWDLAKPRDERGEPCFADTIREESAEPRRAFVAAYNATARPFDWTAMSESIVVKVGPLLTVIGGARR
jgi:hypothetical protein